MKAFQYIRPIIPAVVAYLYVLLFVYAGVSKLTDFENFQVQIAQSTLLNAVTVPVSYGVIVAEIAIGLMLMAPRTRLLATYAGYTLMILFTTYIFIILNFSKHIPCSCGGVLERLGWTQHLLFNLFFVGLALLSILILEARDTTNNVLIRLVILAAIAISFITGLFLWSGHTVRHRNNFTRTFVPFGVHEISKADLQYNSYYFAGSGNRNIYLANLMAPSKITIFDEKLKRKSVRQIILSDTTIPFNTIRVKVLPPNFFVFDGTIPSIHSGNIYDWNANLKMHSVQDYDLAEPIDSNSVVFRAPTLQYGNLLGLFEFNANKKVHFNQALLQKQIDGTFDTDGLLLYNSQSKKVIYLYYYRNQYIVADHNLKLLYRGNTIDTTTKAKIKVATLHKRQQKSLSAPAQFVNRYCATYGNLLFVRSMLPGKVEPLANWDGASIIDVYDYIKQEYLASFYVYDIDGQRMKSFIVTPKYLYALFENQIVAYRFSPELKTFLK